MLRSLLLSILGELQSFFHVSSTLQTIAVNQDKGPHEAVDGPNNQQSAYRFQFHHVLHNTSQVSLGVNVGIRSLVYMVLVANRRLHQISYYVLDILNDSFLIRSLFSAC